MSTLHTIIIIFTWSYLHMKFRHLSDPITSNLLPSADIETRAGSNPMQTQPNPNWDRAANMLPSGCNKLASSCDLQHEPKLSSGPPLGVSWVGKLQPSGCVNWNSQRKRSDTNTNRSDCAARARRSNIKIYIYIQCAILSGITRYELRIILYSVRIIVEWKVWQVCGAESRRERETETT